MMAEAIHLFATHLSESDEGDGYGGGSRMNYFNYPKVRTDRATDQRSTAVAQHEMSIGVFSPTIE